LFGESRAICSHVYMLYSHRGTSLRRTRLIEVYGCEGVGQPFSSVVMSIAVVSVVDMGSLDQISGPPKGWWSAAMSVAMLRIVMDGQSGLLPR
jgi:hypothetical protein